MWLLATMTMIAVWQLQSNNVETL